MRWRSFHVALVCLTVAPLAWLANDTPFLKDAGELTSALWNVGISHPTGFALQQVLAGVARAMPVGCASLRMAWLSVLAAGSVVLFAGLIVASLVRPPGGSNSTSIPGILAGTALLLADVSWFHTVNVEVYLPSLALAALLVYLALRALAEEDRGSWHLFCLAGGLGLGLHVTVVGVACVGALAVLASKVARTRPAVLPVLRRLLFPGLAFALAGALVVLYLPLRAAVHPVRVWADVSGLEGVWGHLTGRSIRSSFAGTMLDTGGAAWAHLQLYGSQILEMVGSWLPLVVAGAWALATRRPQAAALLAAWLLMDGAFAVFVNPMGLAEKQTSLLSLLMLALFAGTGAAYVVDSVLKVRGSYRVVLVPVVLSLTLLLLVLSPVRSLSPAERRSRAGEHGYGMVRTAFAGLGPEGLLVTSQDDLSALSMYAQEVERRRPDAVHIIKHFVCDEPFRDGVGRRSGGNPIIAAWDGAAQRCHGDGEVEVQRAWAELLPALAALAPPLRWELGDGGLDRALRPILLPGYPVFEVRWDLLQEEQRFRTAAFLNQMRGRAKQLAAHFADDISRGVLSEFFRLAGTFLLDPGAKGGISPTDCETLATAVRLDESNCRAWNNLGVCLVLAGQIEKGLEACGSGKDICPRYVRVRLSELRYLLQLGRFSDASAALAELQEEFLAAEWQASIADMRASAKATANAGSLEVLEGP